MSIDKKSIRQEPAPLVRDIAKADYSALLDEVKACIQSAQYAALRAVNKELVGLYWDIGRLIVERQQSEGWGKGAVEQLSTDLRSAFPGVGGFSAQNLWYMRQFFQEYSTTPNLQPLVGEVGWTHNLLILSRCKAAQVREFYLRMTRKFGWSKSVLAQKRTIVEYALLDARKPIGVATYEITKTLPKKLKDQLPSPEAIARLLEGI